MENKNFTNEMAGVQTVSHRVYGIGVVTKKEVGKNSTCITVKSEDGTENQFSIPDSFTLGVMVAEGSLKDEVDAAIVAKKEREAARLNKTKPAPAPVRTPSHRHGRKPATAVVVKGAIETAFETYLVKADYKEYTDSGNPSTVFSYVKAIKTVLDEEGISWNTLQSTIDDIVPIYDVGGAKEAIGAKSNSTVINALKRFKEFVNL